MLFLLICNAILCVCSVQATPSVINKSQLADKQGEPNVINVRQVQDECKQQQKEQLGGVIAIYAVLYRIGGASTYE